VIRFLDTLHGWLVIDVSQGHMSKALLAATSDGGVTWATSTLPFSGAVTFRSATRGWLVGGNWTTLQNQLASTQDGGTSWTIQSLPRPSTVTNRDFQPVIAVPAFFNDLSGVEVVNFGTTVALYTTGDGGTTWVNAAQFGNVAGDEFAPPVVAASGRSAWVVVGHSLFVTHDAGVTWLSIPHSQSLVGAMALGLVSDTVGWALTENGTCAQFKSNCTVSTTVLRSVDGGAKWTAVPVPGLG
jgi:photosystem II stability/assembly factor-like uncharacterized protein